MHNYDVIIVGGGPAGAACAKQLVSKGFNTVILEKVRFPRPKLCAGWITPEVLEDLDIRPRTSPFGMICFKTIYFHLYGITIPVKTCQYSIRRFEFDHWLIKTSNARVIHHPVRNIDLKDKYIVDGKYRSNFIVGAGGTNCPVARTFFKSHAGQPENHCIVALEKEFKTPYFDSKCHLWFFNNQLPGYAWFVPKKDGYLNIGIGGKLGRLKRRKDSILTHWQAFIEELVNSGKIPSADVRPKGYRYYLKNRISTGQKENAFIIGDALGLATLDMGEGIGPAVKSGQLAAESIITGQKYQPDSISRFSLPSMILSGFHSGSTT